MAPNMARRKCILVISATILLILPISSAFRIGSKAKTIHLAPEYTQHDLGEGYTRIRRSNVDVKDEENAPRQNSRHARSTTGVGENVNDGYANVTYVSI